MDRMNRAAREREYAKLALDEAKWLIRDEIGAKVVGLSDLSGLDVVIMVEAWEGLERLCEAGEKAGEGGEK